MDFTSDNTNGADPAILRALINANEGFAAAYGADHYTAAALVRLSEVFEHELAGFFVATGTAANALALAAITPPFGAVFCQEEAHIMKDECGAPEMFSGGAKLIGVAGGAGRIAAHNLKARLAEFPRGVEKQVQPAALSLSQVTECGTVYTREELSVLCALAHDAGLIVHMDGARFANALVSLYCTPAEMSWKAGVDVLSFGATKNGAVACEVVIFFDEALAADLPYLRKRSGHTISKGRFLGAQMIAYLENDRWLKLAAAANLRAQHLANGLAKIPGVRLPWPCQANEVFAIIPRAIDRALASNGARYYAWRLPSSEDACAPLRSDEVFVRLVASFATTRADIDQFLQIAADTIRDNDVNAPLGLRATGPA